MFIIRWQKILIARVREKSLGQEVLRSISRVSKSSNIFHDELTALLGGDAQPLVTSAPARIMLVGLQWCRQNQHRQPKLALCSRTGKAPLLFALDLPGSRNRSARYVGETGLGSVFRPVSCETDLLPVDEPD